MLSKIYFKEVKKFIILSFPFLILGCATLKPGKQPYMDFVSQRMKVGVILSPSGSLSPSYLGVLQALEKKKIKIEAVVGMGWGAFVGALYAKNASIHEAQWNLYKKKLPFEKKKFWKSRQNVSEFLNNFLPPETLKSQVRDFNIKFSCPSFSLFRSTSRLENSGSLSRVLGRCLAFPPWLNPSEEGFVSSSFFLKEAYESLKPQVDVVIFVETLSSRSLRDFNFQDDYASLVIHSQLKASVKELLKSLKNEPKFEVLSLKLNRKSSKNELFLNGAQQAERAFKVLEDKYGF